MDERRDPPPEPVTRPPVISSGAGRLSPVQEAYSRYVTHRRGCDTCRDIDAGRCETAENLWRAYQGHGDAAYRRLAKET